MHPWINIYDEDFDMIQLIKWIGIEIYHSNKLTIMVIRQH